MKTIAELDKNFALKEFSLRAHTKVYNVLEPPFSVHGLITPRQPGDLFRRIPKEVAQTVSDGVAYLHAHCAGGRVRFRTDSSYIGVIARMDCIEKMPHFALTGSAGFDLYCGKLHAASFQPRFDITDRLFGEMQTQGRMEEYTLNFPLYSGVQELYVILDDTAAVAPASPYAQEKPIVFYGSSITQGGCASRPGTCYTALVARRMEYDHINLGFSGNAMGEMAMAEYIAGLNMAAFVYDYDYNAPDAAHLAATHEAFFKKVRQAHPEIPILCLNRPFFMAEEARTAIIRTTVENARKQGDRNTVFLDISAQLQKTGVANEATVDRCHPNDLGFFHMAQAVEPVLREMLGCK